MSYIQYAVSIVTGSELNIPAAHAHTGQNSTTVAEQQSDWKCKIMNNLLMH